MSKRIWISWETQRRSIELAKKFVCKLYIIKKEGLLRYPYSIFKTLFILVKARPDLFFVQNPSMFLATLACIYGFVTKTYIIVDRHTTLRLLKSNSSSVKLWLFKKMHYFTLKYAHLTRISKGIRRQSICVAGCFA